MFMDICDIFLDFSRELYPFNVIFWLIFNMPEDTLFYLGLQLHFTELHVKYIFYGIVLIYY